VNLIYDCLPRGTEGGAQGSGKLFLRPDGKSIARLTMEAMSNTGKRKIKLNFVAE
jgi:hypothetical protein